MADMCHPFFLAPRVSLLGSTTRKSKLACRDKNDQPFLDLAENGKADLLVTGDRDLVALAGQTRFFIETRAAYRARVSGLQDDTLS
jgi:predicted nucleic acid-binding protein